MVCSGRKRVGVQGLVRAGVAAVLLPGLALLVPGQASGGGFELPDNGARAVGRGSAFTVRADDLTAIAHNPAGLLRETGTRAQWSHNVVHAPMQFTRQPTTLPAKPLPKGADPLAPTQNQTPWFALGGMLMAATDFGMKDWAFAAGIYGPSAAGHQEWPVSGGQRYMLTGLDVLLVYYSAAIAHGRKDHWGVGLTLQAAHQLQTELKLVVDAFNGEDLSPYYNPNDVEATITLSAPPVPTAILGGWWRPAPWLELGASGRVLPVRMKATGNIALANTPTGSQFTQAQLEVEGGAARLTLIIPPTARLGARYRHMDGETERFDVEFNFVYEAWSMLKEYKVELDGDIKLFAKQQAPDVIIAKNWKDTLSARLGGTYNLPAQPVSISAGAFYETGAVPDNYTHLDFPSFDRTGVSAGVKARVGKVDLDLSYSHVFQEDRVVDEAFGKVFQQRPISPCPCQGPGTTMYDGVPANAGTFESSFDVVGLSATIKF